MPLFQCSKCGCVENTAVSDYAYQTYGLKQKPLCSECFEGKWHGMFAKRSAVGMFIDQHDFLWSEDQLANGYLPQHLVIVVVIEEHPKEYCPKCCKLWELHDFGVPEPECP